MFTHWRGKLDHAETTLKEVRDVRIFWLYSTLSGLTSVQRAKPQPTHLPPILPSLANPLVVIEAEHEDRDYPLEDQYSNLHIFQLPTGIRQVA